MIKNETEQDVVAPGAIEPFFKSYGSFLFERIL